MKVSLSPNMEILWACFSGLIPGPMSLLFTEMTVKYSLVHPPSGTTQGFVYADLRNNIIKPLDSSWIFKLWEEAARPRC